MGNPPRLHSIDGRAPDGRVWKGGKAFDCNRFALMGHGLCRDLLARLTVGHEVIVGAPVLEELRTVLIEKFRVPPEVWRRVEAKLREFGHAPASSLTVNAVIPDPDDIPIMACALAAGVDVIVTGDKALVELGKIDDVPILTPRQLWQRLG